MENACQLTAPTTRLASIQEQQFSAWKSGKEGKENPCHSVPVQKEDLKLRKKANIEKNPVAKTKPHP